MGSLLHDPEDTVTFPNVSVSGSGVYQLEIDHVTSGEHSLFMSINDGDETELDLNGSSAVLPSSTVIPIQLKTGKNSIRFANHGDEASALDRIAIFTVLDTVNLTTTMVAKTGSVSERVWKVDVANSGDQLVKGAQVNLLTLTQAGGPGTYQSKYTGPLPLSIGNTRPWPH